MPSLWVLSDWLFFIQASATVHLLSIFSLLVQFPLHGPLFPYVLFSLNAFLCIEFLFPHSFHFPHVFFFPLVLPFPLIRVFPPILVFPLILVFSLILSSLPSLPFYSSLPFHPSLPSYLFLPSHLCLPLHPLLLSHIFCHYSDHQLYSIFRFSKFFFSLVPSISLASCVQVCTQYTDLRCLRHDGVASLILSLPVFSDLVTFISSITHSSSSCFIA